MARFSTFLFILAVGAVGAYFLSRGPSANIRQFTTSSISIDSLVDDPSKYDGQLVKVGGTVGASLGVMGVGGFRLLDRRTGSEILVMTSGGIPPIGTDISVFGKFKQAMAIGAYQYAVIFRQD
jgi:hypothetical protein